MRESCTSASDNMISNSFGVMTQPSPRCDLQIVEPEVRLPVIEAKMVVSPAPKGLRVVHFEQNVLIHSHRENATDPLDPEPVGPTWLDFAGLTHDPVVSVLVHPGQHVQRIVPAAKNDDVARRRVAIALRMRRTVSEDLDLDVPFSALAPHVEFNPNIAGQSPEKPKRMILGPLHMKLAIFDPPVATGLLVGVAKLGSLEVIGEPGANSGIALRGAGCKQQAGGSVSPKGAALGSSHRSQPAKRAMPAHQPTLPQAAPTAAVSRRLRMANSPSRHDCFPPSHSAAARRSYLAKHSSPCSLEHGLQKTKHSPPY